MDISLISFMLHTILDRDARYHPFNSSVVEYLRFMLKESKHRGDLKGIKISAFEVITHLLFVDDVLFLYAGSSRDFLELKGILDLFYVVTSMKSNLSKSCILVNILCQRHEFVRRVSSFSLRKF